MSQEQLTEILAILRELRLSALPSRCLELSKDRFHHSPSVLAQFNIYGHSYNPEKCGPLPELFEDLATFDHYVRLQLDAFGMDSEAERLEQLLEKHGLVVVVDGTNYHPELASTVQDQRIENDTETTTEVWGDYVRPAERLLRAFALRLIEGRVSDRLANHSLISVMRPEKAAKVYQTLVKKFYGVDLAISPDLAQVNQVLADLTLHDSNVILVVDAQAVKNMEQYRQFVGLLEKYRLRIILRAREPLPGVPQVLVQPFLDHEIPERLDKARDSLTRKLGLQQPLSPEVLRFTADQVRRLRRPSSDPLNLCLQTIRGAAEAARMQGLPKLTETEIVSTLPAIFHLPDAEQMRQRIRSIDAFAARAPLEVLGQQKAIASIASRMKSHILGLRDPSRPLTLLLPGPTGVGKTELMLRFAQAADMPFFQIEGAQFAESHTISRLTGSPSGYEGTHKGILYSFLEQNVSGIVFIDEIEKMHPDVYTALMNFFDKAILTAGDGSIVNRPGMIIVGASNAGAEQLHRDMDERRIRDVLSEAFVDRNGHSRPELVRRFEPIVMLAIDEAAFKEILTQHLQSIGSRYGFINAGLRLSAVDDAAAKLLYEESKDVCMFDERSMNNLGEFGFHTILPNSHASSLFYDMRHVSRAVDRLAGEAIQRAAEEQYRHRQPGQRSEPKNIRLVGDLARRRIIVVEA